MAKSFLNSSIPGLSRGVRNNNPGNLVRTNIDWEGKIPHSQSTDIKFEQFYELRYGIRALMRDIITGLKRGTNIVQFINEYAPAVENNTAAYIGSVVAALGINSNVQLELSEDIVLALAKIIVRVENGNDASYIAESDYAAAIQILGVDLKKKAVTTQS